MNVYAASVALATALICAGGAVAQTETQFGTRSARTCDKLKVKPTPEQAAAIYQCSVESKMATRIVLLENVLVEIGGPQPYNYQAHHMLYGVDTESQVYPIRGSYQYYDCVTLYDDNRGRNCYYVNYGAAAGYCWATTFGDWSCAMNPTTSPPGESNHAPPA